MPGMIVVPGMSGMSGMPDIAPGQPCPHLIRHEAQPTAAGSKKRSFMRPCLMVRSAGPQYLLTHFHRAWLSFMTNQVPPSAASALALRDNAGDGTSDRMAAR